MQNEIRSIMEALSRLVVQNAPEPEPQIITIRRLPNGELDISATVKLRIRA